MGRQVSWRRRVGDGPVSRHCRFERVVRTDAVETELQIAERGRKGETGIAPGWDDSFSS